MSYGRGGVTIEMDGGYTLSISWNTYPSAILTFEDKMIAGQEWMMTDWFFVRPRITRWALRSIRAHEKMMRRLQAKNT